MIAKAHLRGEVRLSHTEAEAIRTEKCYIKRMAQTPSTMIPLGTPFPHFTLPEPLSGVPISTRDLDRSKGTLVMVICNHCPYVIHVLPQIKAITEEYSKKGLAIVAFSSNDAVKYPADGPAQIAEFAKEHALLFPYLYDESQDVARSFDAACTPEFYLFDSDDLLVYRGQLDGSTPKNDVPLTGDALRGALKAHFAGEPIDEEQRPSVGCNIKWKE